MQPIENSPSIPGVFNENGGPSSVREYLLPKTMCNECRTLLLKSIKTYNIQTAK